MMTLYYSPNACSLAVHIALEEAGTPYKLVLVSFERGEQRSDTHMKLHPLGRVPVLMTAEGALTEASAILAYIAGAYPAAALAPSHAFSLAKMYAFNAFIASTVHVTFAHAFRAERWADDAAARDSIRTKAPKDCVSLFRLINEKWLANPWVLGDQYTVADPYLFVMTRWLNRLKLDMGEFPRIAAHYARLSERPAVQRALEREGLI
jgi:glutathione S-transferase